MSELPKEVEKALENLRERWVGAINNRADKLRAAILQAIDEAFMDGCFFAHERIGGGPISPTEWYGSKTRREAVEHLRGTKR